MTARHRKPLGARIRAALGTKPGRPIVAVFVAALVVLGVGTIGAHADSTQADGAYGCAFTAGTFNCSPTALPTTTVTNTVTTTATATTTVTASPSPTDPPLTTLTGVSTPGLSVFPNAKAVRTYSSGLPDSSIPSNIAAGASVFTSFKTLPSDATFATDLAAWGASGHPVYWTYYHEADGGGLTPTAYQNGWAALLADEAAHPYPNVHSVTILMAYCFVRGNCEPYYVPNVDFLGFDCYTLSNEATAINYADTKGKRMIFGEVGNETGGTDTDAAALAYAKSFWPALTPTVLAAMWWSGSADDLNGMPNTTAYLKSQP